MNTSLSDYFPFRREDFEFENRFTLCLEKGQCSSSHFSFSYLLLRNVKSLFLQGKGSSSHRVVVISANHDNKHFRTILKKQNVDVDYVVSTAQLQFIYLQFESDVSLASDNPTDKTLMSWNDLESWLQRETTSTSESQTIDLMIDDLEMLELLAPSPFAARRFLSSCLHRMNNNFLRKQKNDSVFQFLNDEYPNKIYAVNIRNIVLYGREAVDSDVDMRKYSLNLLSSDTTPETGAADLSFAASNLRRLNEFGEPILSQYLLSRADVVVEASPLESGHSSEVHGILRISCSPSVSRGRSSPTLTKGPSQYASSSVSGVSGIAGNSSGRQSLLYKALDSGVVCSAVGEGFG